MAVMVLLRQLHHNMLKKCLQLNKDFNINIVKNTTSHQRTEPVTSLATKASTAEHKMLSKRSPVLSGYSKKNTIDSVKANSESKNLLPLAAAALAVQTTGLTLTPTRKAAAAAAYIYLEKVKNERMSPRLTAKQLDFLKDAIMESKSSAAAVAAAIVKNNNFNNNYNSIHNNNISNNKINIVSENNSPAVNIQVQNSISKSEIYNISEKLKSHSFTQSSNHTHQIHKHQPPLHHQSLPQQQQQSIHMNSCNVKNERLSPGTNGDLLRSFSSSGSTTPPSPPGTSPQQSNQNIPSEELGSMHNLSTSLLNSIHQAAAASPTRQPNLLASGINSAYSNLPSGFSTRNYSDFMRSLAAKYNNTNENPKATTNNTTQQKEATSGSQKRTSYASTVTPINKEVFTTTTSSLPHPLTSIVISPRESAIKLTQQNKLASVVANAAAACSSNVSPHFMTSFLSSLPFSSGICPALVDMSNTQALIILARAAKENEIDNILNRSSLHQKRTPACISSSPGPSLCIALQQAEQFISPALIYSFQKQKQQVPKESSPRLTNVSNFTPSCIYSKTSRNQTKKMNVSPLDLSSQPPAAKRFKAEFNNLINSTIVRRESSSTAATYPSPPPFNEKFSLTDKAVVGLSTKTEVTTKASFTPFKACRPTTYVVTSSPSSIAPPGTGSQCQAYSEGLNSWTVDDVCEFVGSIDICAKYVKNFRDQCIDGSGLPLLTEDHLVNSLGMKLGPALKLRSLLAKKLGGPCPCVSCVAQVQHVLALQANNKPTTSTGIAATTASLGSPLRSNTSKICSEINSSGNICNSHIQENSLIASFNMSNNNCAYQNTETSSSEANSTYIKADCCVKIDEAVKRDSNCDTNIGNLTSPSLQEDHNQEQYPSQNNCNKSGSNFGSDNIGNSVTNRHDNLDSSSSS